jgi:hypothetical protein
VDTDEELDAAISAHSAAEERVASLRAEKERLTRQVAGAHGENGACGARSRRGCAAPPS